MIIYLFDDDDDHCFYEYIDDDHLFYDDDDDHRFYDDDYGDDDENPRRALQRKAEMSQPITPYLHKKAHFLTVTIF